MARVRMTTFIRQTTGLEARLRAKTRAQVQAIQAASGEDFDRTLNTFLSLTPVDTGYSLEHVYAVRTREGFHWVMGFRRADFVGQVNPATGEQIKAFYIFIVIHGRLGRAGNNFPRRAFQATDLARREGFRRALRVRG